MLEAVCVVLPAQLLLWSCHQDVKHSYSHLKAWVVVGTQFNKLHTCSYWMKVTLLWTTSFSIGKYSYYGNRHPELMSYRKWEQNKKQECHCDLFPNSHFIISSSHLREEFRFHCIRTHSHNSRLMRKF
jgi:hypothetical protein